MPFIGTSLVLTPGSTPSVAKGKMYYDSTTNATYIYNGDAWEVLSSLTAGENVSRATGGTKTVVGGYTFHAFTGSGTFTIGAAGRTGKLICDLIVIGGGGAGSVDHGGGGGAGALAWKAAHSLDVGNYTVTIGPGGVAGWGNNPSGYQSGGTSRMFPEAARGESSSFGGSLIVAYGGGGGTGCCNVITQGGGNIGSQGGALRASGLTAINKGTTSIGASIWGNLTTAGTVAYTGGGGGGAGGAGASSTTGLGGIGARPVGWADAWGTDTNNDVGGGYFAGGGGGGSHSQDSITNQCKGGYGGGGGFALAATGYGNTSADHFQGMSGVSNTGSGGSGHTNSTTGGPGSGAAGIVLIRYPS